MAFNRPSLAALIERAQTDMETRLPGIDARLRRSVVGTLARTHAGALHGIYGYLDYLAEQLMPDAAELEYLERWASVWGLQRKAADPATGTATFTGTDGAVIPAGTTLQRSDSAEYTADIEGVISGGVVTLDVTAVEVGSDGDTANGSTLTLVSPITGVNATATVEGDGITGGADEEDDESLRQRLLYRLANPPRGGTQLDYVAWALEVPGVTRAWCYPLENGNGTVTVRFVTDDADNLIPDSETVAQVQTYIDAQRPVTAEVTVEAPTPVALDFGVTYIDPDDSKTRAAVEAELADLLLLEAEPGGTVLLSHIRAAISRASSEENYILTSPSADVTHAMGEIATLGTVSWP